MITLPIIAIEQGGDICCFDTLEEAESYIEPEDVKANEYKIYDGMGFKLLATLVKGRGWLAPQRVKLLELGQDAASELCDDLKDYLSRVGKNVLAPSCSLLELINILRSHLRGE